MDNIPFRLQDMSNKTGFLESDEFPGEKTGISVLFSSAIIV